MRIHRLELYLLILADGHEDSRFVREDTSARWAVHQALMVLRETGWYEDLLSILQEECVQLGTACFRESWYILVTKWSAAK